MPLIQLLLVLICRVSLEPDYVNWRLAVWIAIQFNILVQFNMLDGVLLAEACAN